MTARYPNIRGIDYKDTFGQAMKFAVSQDPEAFDFVPPTFELQNPDDAALFKEYQAKNPQATFIAKPAVGSQGDSICLFKELNDLPYTIGNKELII